MIIIITAKCDGKSSRVHTLNFKFKNRIRCFKEEDRKNGTERLLHYTNTAFLWNTGPCPEKTAHRILNLPHQQTRIPVGEK